MKNALISLLVVSCLLLTACSNERSINGRSEKTAAKSVKIMKEYLSSDQRVEFELAYWTTRDAHPDSKEFLNLVNGKSVAQMIAVGKQSFDQQKAAGKKGYDKYASWEEMVAKMIAERKAQSLGQTPETQLDKDNNILYKHSP